jgi:hypothetical protein
MKVGDRIRVQRYVWGHSADCEDYTIEEFHYCLGFFETEDHRKAGKFTPLCSLLEPGPESKEEYISNFGPYHTNLVQGWMDIC